MDSHTHHMHQTCIFNTTYMYIYLRICTVKPVFYGHLKLGTNQKCPDYQGVLIPPGQFTMYHLGP